MNNLTMEGWDTSDVKYLDADRVTCSELSLRRGDLLVNRTNGSMRLVGKAAMFDLPGQWLFASYLLRLRLNRRRVDPEFVEMFLNSPAGRLQVERLARPILMINISPDELKTIMVPLPPLAEQRALVEPLRAAWRDRRQLRAQATAELAKVNVSFERRTGVAGPAGGSTMAYAAPAKVLQSARRFGAQFFHPERAAILSAVLSARKAVARSVLGVADISADRVDVDPGDPVLGLAAVEPGTGELVLAGEDATIAQRYGAGDVLYSRLRPYLNKVHRADQNGLCSTEFYVLRPRVDIVHPDYLAVALRSRLFVGQAKHLSTGNTHPRVTVPDLATVFIPVGDHSLQRDVVKEYEARRRTARSLRTQADDDWWRALDAFDAELLGGVRSRLDSDPPGP